MNKLFKLYIVFFRIGLFTFGGGYAMLPMLEREIVERHKWATREELLDYYAIGQCTPGIIAVNTATFVGYSERGFMGALAATLGVITPSFVIILALASFLQNFENVPEVSHAFAGIRAAVASLILAAVINLFKSNVIQLPSNKQETAKSYGALAANMLAPFLIFIVAFAGVAVFALSPVYISIAAAVCGIILYRDRGTL